MNEWEQNIDKQVHCNLNRIRKLERRVAALEKNKPDLASELMQALNEEAKELLGEEEAWELRCNINDRLEKKGLEPIEWE